MSRRPISTPIFLLVALAVTLIVAGVLSFYASGHPDGLEHVAETLGFAGTAGDHAAADSPLADYGTKGVEDPRLSGGIAGVAGVLLVGLVMLALARLLRRRDQR